jgi:hypothetical protein
VEFVCEAVGKDFGGIGDFPIICAVGLQKFVTAANLAKSAD